MRSRRREPKEPREGGRRGVSAGKNEADDNVSEKLGGVGDGGGFISVNISDEAGEQVLVGLLFLYHPGAYNIVCEAVDGADGLSETAF